MTTSFQLSDTHLLAERAPLYGTVASTAGLDRIARGGGFSRIDVIDGEVVASALPTEPTETALDFAPFLASGTSPSSRTAPPPA